MDEAFADGLVRAAGLAIAMIATLIERDTAIPKGEIGERLALMAEAADPEIPHQRAILATWASLVSAQVRPNEEGDGDLG